jgi:hypothetical protein
MHLLKVKVYGYISGDSVLLVGSVILLTFQKLTQPALKQREESVPHGKIIRV